MSDFHFEATARIPCRPLSYTNRALVEPKELIIDYATSEIYVSDEDGVIHNITNVLLEELNEKLKENPDVVTDVSVSLPDGSSITIKQAIIQALGDIDKLKQLLKLIDNEGNLSISVSADDVEETETRKFVTPEDIEKWNKTTESFNEKTVFGDGNPGLVPSASPEDHDKYLKGDGTWGDPTIPEMTGASESAPGTGGTVPAPEAGSQNKFLAGDGTWKSPDQIKYENMKGATSTTEGKSGLVPAPEAGAQDKFLKGDGTWANTPNTTYEKATKNSDGLLSKEDFSKLYDIETKATHTPTTHITTDTKTIEVGKNDSNNHVIAGTDAVTVSTIQTLLGRKNAASAADTEYTILKFRGESLSHNETAPAVNGAIAWKYE